MNTSGSIKITFAAPVLAPPLPKTEVAIQPASPWVRRGLPFLLDIDSSGAVPRGRWDSVRIAARELLIGLIPSRPASTPTLTQLELQFA